MCDIDYIISILDKCELPKESEVKQLCDTAKEILTKEDNVQILSSPITICGDIHGQFSDLQELFFIGGQIPETNYIFMGDFVDRGLFSIQTFLLLLSYKVKYPERIVLLRGNHESRQITQVYGFYDEVIRKYGSALVWRYCTEVFDLLSLAAVIDQETFCVHGGLSPSAKNIDDIKKLDRKQEIPHEGAMTDLLWSDPDVEAEGFGYSPRGAGYIFGEKQVAEFNRINGLTLVARAHQLIMDGYQFLFNDGLVTVWSAPNYCYRCGNKASIMEYDEHMNRAFKKFEAAPTENRQQVDKKMPDYFL